ncbi:MAG: hypothetical protein KJ556_21915, partial [Gammaproteobacteria bacterium]|nr:hypothetical protein [Gammaproteobacteria bacterium]
MVFIRRAAGSQDTHIDGCTLEGDRVVIIENATACGHEEFHILDMLGDPAAKELKARINMDHPLVRMYLKHYDDAKESGDYWRTEVAAEIHGERMPFGIDLSRALTPAPPTARASDAAKVAERAAGRVAMGRAPPVVTPEQDRAYMEAAEAGDMETAQRMVDDAAKAAGYNVGPVYHGGGKRITQFGSAGRGYIGEAYFTDSHEVAQKFAYGGGFSASMTVDEMRARQDELPAGRVPTVTSAYLRGRKILDLDKLRLRRDVFKNDEEYAKKRIKQIEGSIPERIYEIQEETGANFFDALKEYVEHGGAFVQEDTEALSENPTAQYALYLGVLDDMKLEGDYDAVRFRDAETESETWVVDNPSNIKSADPITRDDSGRIIPLSERFNPETPDIRFARTTDLVDPYAAIEDLIRSTQAQIVEYEERGDAVPQHLLTMANETIPAMIKHADKQTAMREAGTRHDQIVKETIKQAGRTERARTQAEAEVEKRGIRAKAAEAISALRDSRKSAKEKQAAAIEYAQSLPAELRGRILAQNKNLTTLVQEATQEAHFREIIKYIDELNQAYDARRERSKLKRIIKDLEPNIRKLSPARKAAATEILESIDLTVSRETKELRSLLEEMRNDPDDNTPAYVLDAVEKQGGQPIP